MDKIKYWRVSKDWVVFRGKRYFKNDLIPVPNGKFKNKEEEYFLGENARQEKDMESVRVVSDISPALVEQEKPQRKAFQKRAKEEMKDE